jgi:steroid delta-isomerase-like uncharacterized protein
MGAAKDLWNEYERLDNKHDSTGLVSLFAIDAVYIERNGRHDGREALRVLTENTHGAFPDLTIEASLLVGDGETAVAEWRWRGTQTGPPTTPDGADIPPSARTLDFPGVSVLEVRDGKIAKMCDYWDNAAMMSQLGLMPSP